MPQLAGTTTNNKHTHLVYLNDETGIGSSSTKRGHVHGIVFSPELNQWVVEPAEDGHSHQLVSYTPKLTKPKKQTEKEKVDIVHALFKAGMTVEHKARKDAKESRGFYNGKHQWDPQVKQELNRAKRASITINETAAKIDLLSGYQRQNEVDIKYAPVEEGDHATALLADAVLKNVQTQNGYSHEKSMVFSEELIEGRGNFHVYVDFDEDVRGKIVVEKLSNREVVYGPHERFDLKDLEHQTKFKKFSKAKIEQMFPEKADDINAMFTNATPEVGEDPIIDNPGDQYAVGIEIEMGINMPSETMVDIERKEVTVLENYRKDYYTEYAILAAEDGFVQPIPMLSKKEADEWDTIPAIRSVRRNKSKVIRTVTAGTVFIEESELDDFDIIPAYAKKDGNYYYGKVEEVKDPQREINKRHSQALDAVNRMSSWNWIIDESTFKDAKTTNDFVQNSATPGYVIKVDNMNSKPEKVDGMRMPAEILGMMDLASNKLREVMNIPEEALGFSSREFSGIALQEKKHSTQMANEYLFDNLHNAERLLSKRILKKVQEHYDVDRIVNLINHSKPEDQEDLIQNQVNIQAAAEMLINEDLTKYDIVATPSISSPTARTANFAILFELAKQGVIQDPAVIIEASDIPQKQKILGNLAAQAQAAQQAEAQKQQTEIIKSLPDELQAQAMGTNLPQGPVQ